MNDSADLPSDTQTIDILLSFWEVRMGRLRQDISLGGSPRRCLKRLAVEDYKGDVFVLESIKPEQAEKRRFQAGILQRLSDSGVPCLQPWLATRQSDFLLPDGRIYWQLRRYAQGIELPRDNYGHDAWRGRAMGDFLKSLRSHANALEPLPVFSLTDYVNHLLEIIQKNNPALSSDLRPIWQELSAFQEQYRRLPQAFCHGDYHPLNIIWGDGNISGVIDWEFMGLKVEAWDLANLLGCLGMDEPAWLTGNMANALIACLHQAPCFHPDTWRWLPELVATLRFAWMREWFHENNRPMQIQELDYLWLLLDNREFLRQKWTSITGN